VCPESMALTLGRVARVETHRLAAPTFVYTPEPFWTELERVRLEGPELGGPKRTPTY